MKNEPTLIRFPNFGITFPQLCQYISGNTERKILTYLHGEMATLIYGDLLQEGFRRIGSMVYKPACENCSACVSVRIRANEFHPNRGFSRIIRKNADLTAEVCNPQATNEQFEVFRRYQQVRHPESDMSEMTFKDYASMIEETPVFTHLIEYRRDGRLMAACLTDRFEDSFSMVYSFFLPQLKTDSLGTFMILDHVERAKKLEIPFVYLGFWIKNCKKMSYKSRFLPLDALTLQGWKPLKSQF